MGTRQFIIPAGMSFWRALQAGLVGDWRSPAYLAFVASLPCVITGAPAHAHHLIGHGVRGTGKKTNDYLAFPLCPMLHTDGPRAIHVVGCNTWEEQNGDQRIYVAQTLTEAIARGVLKVRP